MAVENPKRIHLISSRGDPRLEEASAAGVIRPGHLLDVNVDGDYVPHPTAEGAHERLFALEDALQGRTINNNYVSGELVFAVHAEPGDVIYAWLAVGEVITKDEFLTSNGDGTLRIANSTDIRVAKAIEAVDNNDSGDNIARIRVRIV